MAAEEEGGIPLPPAQVPRYWVRPKGALDLFEISLRAFWLNTSLSVPVLLLHGLSSLGPLLTIVITIFTATYLASEGVLRALVDAVVREDLYLLLQVLSTPEVMWALYLALALGFVVFLITRSLGIAFAYSGLYKMAEELLTEGKTSLRTFVVNSEKNWRELFPIAILTETLIFLPPFLIGLLFMAQLLGMVGLTNLGELSMWVLIAFLPIGFYLLLVVIATFFIYTVAALEPGKGFLYYAGESVRAVLKRPEAVLVYVLFKTAFLIGLSLLASLISVLGVVISSLISLIIVLVLEPCFQVVKTGIYIQAKDRLVLLRPGRWAVGAAASRTLGRSFRELKAFLSDGSNWVLVLLSSLTFLLGLSIGGWIGLMGEMRYAARLLGFIRTGRLREEFQWPFSPFTGFYIAFYNWKLALASSTAGYAACIPVLLFLFTNGLIVGLVAALIGNAWMALAALLPHGVIEVPAFLIASACGLRMGLIYLAYRRRDLTPEEAVKALRTCIYALVGLIPLFLIAGLVEALVTPLVMRLYGWR